MEFLELSKTDRDEYHYNFREELLLEYPKLEVPDRDLFFEEINPIERPSFFRRLY